MSYLTEVLDRMLAVVYPHRCVLCDEVVEYDDIWCEKCDPALSGLVSMDIPHRMEEVAAPFYYEDEVRAMILRLKESGDKRTLRFVAERMTATMGSLWPERPFDLLVPVPTSEGRRKKRGFNPTELIAAEIQAAVGIPVEAKALSRREDSASQRDLSARERKKNAISSYELEKGELLAGKRVLLIDDVVTTGSTLAACSELLYEAGCASIHALAAANTRYSQKESPVHEVKAVAAVPAAVRFLKF